ncbi:MAG: hypothetical protein IJ161_06830 [Bacteroidales bacterium]|nr:hypothetical protein [Bacteroidales bacterium]
MSKNNQTSWDEVNDCFTLVGVGKVDQKKFIQSLTRMMKKDGFEGKVYVEDRYDKEVDKDWTSHELYLCEGYSSTGIHLYKDKSGEWTIYVISVASMVDVHLAWNMLTCLSKEFPKMEIVTEENGQMYSFTLMDENIDVMKTRKVFSVLSLMNKAAESGNIIFLDGAYRHFAVIPMDENVSPTERVERFAILMNSFVEVQWKYRDYRDAPLSHMSTLSGEQADARILTNNSDVFVGYAERFALYSPEGAVKIVHNGDFIDLVSSYDEYEFVDGVQFVLRKMPEDKWKELFDEAEGELLKRRKYDN